MLVLREAIDRFLENDDFKELRKYQLNENEWTALEVFKEILAVRIALYHSICRFKICFLGASCIPAKVISREDTNTM